MVLRFNYAQVYKFVATATGYYRTDRGRGGSRMMEQEKTTRERLQEVFEAFYLLFIQLLTINY